MNKEARRQRYLRDPLPIRLGGIAANLARVASCAESQLNSRAVVDMIYESKFFIEWAAPTAPIETAATLVELQLALVQWQNTFSKQHSDPAVCSVLSKFAREWSERLLQMSGLLFESSGTPA